MKKSLRIILCTLAAYVVLLFLLVAAESRDPSASIRSIWDAVWYSLITMTTVGYGDLSPVTPLGRILGLIFALCSIGILAALIGIGLRLIAGQFIPSIRLRLGRNHSWYVFREENEDTKTLAEDLRRVDKGCLILFPADGEKSIGGRDVVRLDADIFDLLRLRKGHEEGISLFCMGSDPWKNYAEARSSAGQGVQVYCMTDVSAADPSADLQLFSRSEVMSRCYWKEHPLSSSEQCVLIAGNGASGRTLLERALLTNVFVSGRRVEYHVFGGCGEFEELHPRIVRELSPEKTTDDSLILRREDLFACPDLLKRADRIILCYDEDSKNLEIYEKLRTWFPIRAKVHVRLTDPAPPVCSFGTRREIITAELVMKEAINRRAVLMNEIYNKNSTHPVAWQDLGWFLRQSNIAVADHLPVKIRLLLEDDSLTEVTEELCRRAYDRFLSASQEELESFREMEHRRWMRFYWLYNWQFAPERSNPDRLHPLLIDYDALPKEEQAKDSHAWEMLGRMADHI